jgi:hypothetical protein
VYRAFADVDELAAELTALKAGWTRPNVPPDQLALLPEVAPGAAPAKPKRRRRKRADNSAVVPFPEDRSQNRQVKAN